MSDKVTFTDIGGKTHTTDTSTYKKWEKAGNVKSSDYQPPPPRTPDSKPETKTVTYRDSSGKTRTTNLVTFIDTSGKEKTMTEGSYQHALNTGVAKPYTGVKLGDGSTIASETVDLMYQDKLAKGEITQEEYNQAISLAYASELILPYIQALATDDKQLQQTAEERITDYIKMGKTTPQEIQNQLNQSYAQDNYNYFKSGIINFNPPLQTQTITHTYAPLSNLYPQDLSSKKQIDLMNAITTEYNTQAGSNLVLFVVENGAISLNPNLSEGLKERVTNLAKQRGLILDSKVNVSSKPNTSLYTSSGESNPNSIFFTEVEYTNNIDTSKLHGRDFNKDVLYETVGDRDIPRYKLVDGEYKPLTEINGQYIYIPEGYKYSSEGFLLPKDVQVTKDGTYYQGDVFFKKDSGVLVPDYKVIDHGTYSEIADVKIDKETGQFYYETEIISNSFSGKDSYIKHIEDLNFNKYGKQVSFENIPTPIIRQLENQNATNDYLSINKSRLNLLSSKDYLEQKYFVSKNNGFIALDTKALIPDFKVVKTEEVKTTNLEHQDMLQARKYVNQLRAGENNYINSLTEEYDFFGYTINLKELAKDVQNTRDNLYLSGVYLQSGTETNLNKMFDDMITFSFQSGKYIDKQITLSTGYYDGSKPFVYFENVFGGVGSFGPGILKTGTSTITRTIGNYPRIAYTSEVAKNPFVAFDTRLEALKDMSFLSLESAFYAIPVVSGISSGINAVFPSISKTGASVVVSNINPYLVSVGLGVGISGTKMAIEQVGLDFDIPILNIPINIPKKQYNTQEFIREMGFTTGQVVGFTIVSDVSKSVTIKSLETGKAGYNLVSTKLKNMIFDENTLSIIDPTQTKFYEHFRGYTPIGKMKNTPVRLDYSINTQLTKFKPSIRNEIIGFLDDVDDLYYNLSGQKHLFNPTQNPSTLYGAYEKDVFKLLPFEQMKPVSTSTFYTFDGSQTFYHTRGLFGTQNQGVDVLGRHYGSWNLKNTVYSNYAKEIIIDPKRFISSSVGTVYKDGKPIYDFFTHSLTKNIGTTKVNTLDNIFEFSIDKSFSAISSKIRTGGKIFVNNFSYLDDFFTNTKITYSPSITFDFMKGTSSLTPDMSWTYFKDGTKTSVISYTARLQGINELPIFEATYPSAVPRTFNFGISIIGGANITPYKEGNYLEKMSKNLNVIKNEVNVIKNYVATIPSAIILTSNDIVKSSRELINYKNEIIPRTNEIIPINMANLIPYKSDIIINPQNQITTYKGEIILYENAIVPYEEQPVIIYDNYEPIHPLPPDPIPPIPIPPIPPIGGGWDNRGYHTSNKQIRDNLLERRVEVASVSAGVFGVRTRALKGTSFDTRFEAVKSKPYSTIKVSRLGENKMPQAVLPKERKKKKVLKTTGFKMPSFKNPKF